MNFKVKLKATQPKKRRPLKKIWIEKCLPWKNLNKNFLQFQAISTLFNSADNLMCWRQGTLDMNMFVKEWTHISMNGLIFRFVWIRLWFFSQWDFLSKKKKLQQQQQEAISTVDLVFDSIRDSRYFHQLMTRDSSVKDKRKMKRRIIFFFSILR